MSRLIPNSTPAERAIKCSWAETLEDTAKVVANGGEIFGTPTIDFGAVLNGTTDYIIYALLGREFNSPVLSIVGDLWPDFETDEDKARYIFASVESARDYSFFKLANANGNVLFVTLGGTSIGSIPEATYSPYWKVGERNVFQIVSDGSSTYVWLNGNLIMNADPTAWTPKLQTSLFVGSTLGGASKFKGKIGPIKVFHSLLTAQDALNYYNNANYTYMNDAILHLPMRASEHDPTKLRTLDVSGNANHAAFGPGAAEPTKLQKRGYSGDGGDYLDCGDLGVADDWSVTVMLKKGITGLKYGLGLMDSHAAIQSAGMFLSGVSGERLGVYDGTGTYHDANTILPIGKITPITLTFKGATNALGIYMDKAFRHGATTSNNMDLDHLTIMCRPDLFGRAVGDFFEVSVQSFILTPLQVADLHIRMLKQVNHV